jgi:hypothetical protein
MHPLNSRRPEASSPSRPALWPMPEGPESGPHCSVKPAVESAVPRRRMIEVLGVNKRA